jgi:hypothetical protein
MYRPWRHQRNVIARENPLAKRSTRICHAALQPQRIGNGVRCAVFDAEAARRIKIDVRPDGRKRYEQDFIIELHVIHARLPFKPTEASAESAFNIARGLRLQIEIDRKCIHADSLVDVRRSEAVCDPAENSEYRREPVLKSEMQCVIRL